MAHLSHSLVGQGDKVFWGGNWSVLLVIAHSVFSTAENTLV